MYLRVKVRMAAIGYPAPEHRYAISFVDPGTIIGRNETLIGLKAKNALHAQRATRQRQLLPVDRFDCFPIFLIYIAAARSESCATGVRDTGCCACGVASIAEVY